MARLTRQLGRALSGFYRGTVPNTILSVLAVLLGFGLASAWQGREESLKEMRNLLGVLNPLTDEVTVLRGELRVMQRESPCDISKIKEFNTSLWQSISTSERALILGDLYPKVRSAYTTLTAAPIGAKPSEARCRELLASLRNDFDALRETMKSRLLSVEAEYKALREVQASGLWSFVGATLGWSVVLLVLLPAALYGLMALVTRVTY